MRRIALIFFLLAFAVPALALAEKVLYVIDGDTIVVGHEETVRFIGINAPEIDHPKYGKLGEPFGQESKEYLQRLLDGHDVRLEGGDEPTDRFKRTLAYVFRDDGLFVNRDMVEKGWAEVYRRFNFKYKTEFLELEKKARQAHLGMWTQRPGDWKEQFLHWLSSRGPHRK